MEKEENENREEEGSNGKDTDRDQCQLGSNCKSNDGETEVNDPIIIIFPLSGFINQKLMKFLSFPDVLATYEFTLQTHCTLCPSPEQKSITTWWASTRKADLQETEKDIQQLNYKCERRNLVSSAEHHDSEHWKSWDKVALDDFCN